MGIKNIQGSLDISENLTVQGKEVATQEWVQTKIPTIDTDTFAKLNSYNTFTKGNSFIADYSFNGDGTRNSFDIRVDYNGEGFLMQANPGGWYISDLSQTQSFNMDNKGNFYIQDSINNRYTTYSLPVLNRSEDVVVTASQIEWLIVK